jgi:hypothetical protein
MKNSKTVQLAVLLSAAIAIGLLTPTFVPAVASVNSHSLNINSSSLTLPMGNSTFSLNNTTLTIETPGLNPTYTICSAIISQVPTSGSSNGTIYFTITIVPGSCHPANG